MAKFYVLGVLLIGHVFAIVSSYEAPIKCEGPHEKLCCVKECPPERTCANRGIKFRCVEDERKCEYKCVCEEEYYRNTAGECISDKQCDLCRSVNEEYTRRKCSCPPETCISLVSLYDCSKAPPCGPGCACKSGFIRLKEGKPCMDWRQCPQVPRVV